MLFRSLWYDRWINTAVAVGVLCATAVLTGALLVGDSMRGSLRALTLDRLGDIDTILFAPGFIEYSNKEPEVQRSVTSGWAPGSSAALHFRLSESEGVILLPAAAQFNDKIVGIQLLGRGDSYIANQALADAVGLQSGDTLALRLMPPQAIPPESSLGRKDQLLRTRIRVDEIIPNTGIGRFSLKMDQQAEPLLIVPIERLQRLLDVDDKVNAIFYYGDSPISFGVESLENLGIVVEFHGDRWYVKSARMLFTDEQVEEIRRRKVFPRQSEVTKGLLYLATSIRAVKNNRETPYSTVYATDTLTEPLQSRNRKVAPFDSQSSDCGSDNIALNRWTADDLDVQIGDKIELTWFDPHDVNITHRKTFTLSDILPMEGLGADPYHVPTVQGFTDEASIADWDPPFPFDAKKIRQKDEDYWDTYRAAPKAFVSLELGQELFGSRFGKVTTFVVSYSDICDYCGESLSTENTNCAKRVMSIAPFSWVHYHKPIHYGDYLVYGRSLYAPHFGMTLVPVKQQGLAASSGTTPFSILFLAFSFFIIASALMLVMMLFRLSVEMKAKRIGIQLAVGWSAGLVTKTLLLEGFFISLLGSFSGALLGIGYAAVMVYGLTTWWVDAISQGNTSVPFLTLYISPMSLLFGFASGVCLAMLTILWSVRGVANVPLRALLHGNVQSRNQSRNRKVAITPFDSRPSGRGSESFVKSWYSSLIKLLNKPLFGTAKNTENTQKTRWEKIDRNPIFVIPAFLIFGAVFAVLCWIPFDLFRRAELFFVCALFVLGIGLKIVVNQFLKTSAEREHVRSLIGLSLANATRRRGRSMLFIALIASTTFLVLSISAFRLQSTRWDEVVYVGETMFPVYADIGTQKGREQLSIQPEDEKFLAAKSSGFDYWLPLFSFRMKNGDSTSCLNLYQTGNPRILGAPQHLISIGRYFSFAQTVKLLPEERTHWDTLRRPITTDPDGVRRVPVIIDANTAMYALHIYGGVGDVYEYDDGLNGIIRFEIVGLLSNSVLQGEIVMSEENLLKLFPEVGGYRYFLFIVYHEHPEDQERAFQIVHNLLGDYGFQGEPASDRLRKLFAVQNTYLSTFQSLGGIGLLLGIFGLAVIQCRNVLERRKELALLLAIGFSKPRVIMLLLYESFTLLAWGLGLAVLASTFALLPFFLTSVQQVSAVSIVQQFVVLVGGLLIVGIISNVAAALAVLKIPVARELAEER